jgi:hypothetical protein
MIKNAIGGAFADSITGTIPAGRWTAGRERHGDRRLSRRVSRSAAPVPTS